MHGCPSDLPLQLTSLHFDFMMFHADQPSAEIDDEVGESAACTLNPSAAAQCSLEVLSQEQPQLPFQLPIFQFSDHWIICMDYILACVHFLRRWHIQFHLTLFHIFFAFSVSFFLCSSIGTMSVWNKFLKYALFSFHLRSILKTVLVMSHSADNLLQ